MYHCQNWTWEWDLESPPHSGVKILWEKSNEKRKVLRMESQVWNFYNSHWEDQQDTVHGKSESGSLAMPETRNQCFSKGDCSFVAVAKERCIHKEFRVLQICYEAATDKFVQSNSSGNLENNYGVTGRWESPGNYFFSEEFLFRFCCLLKALSQILLKFMSEWSNYRLPIWK